MIKVIGLDNLPLGLAITISLTVGVIASLVFQFIVRPRVIEWIKSTSSYIYF
jgi:hypothetical protein